LKKIWRIRKDSEGVSPVIATILMVAITVVLAAVLYVMVLGFGGTSSTPSIQILQRTTVNAGYKIALTNPTATVKWDDVSAVQLSDGTNTVSWTNVTTAKQTTGTPGVGKYGSKSLGTLTVFLNITDLAGDGKIGNGDYLIFTTFVSPTFASTGSYSMTLLYKPTGGSMVSAGLTS
jgi:flagellin-like protein